MRRAAALPILLVVAFALSGCDKGTKVTRENYEKVNTEMTVDEVEAILGPGEIEHSTGASVGDVAISGQTRTWTDGDKVITIQFINGKVALKTQKGLG